MLLGKKSRKGYFNMYYKMYQTRYAKKNKFGAVKTHGFDSKKEFNRYQELKLLEKAGEVSDIKAQERFDLYGKNGNKICSYKADFTYFEKDGTRVIEDVKSKITCTSVFRIKWKLLEDNLKEQIHNGEIKLLINFC